MAESKPGGESTGLEIAVIGMALRCPGARNIDEFWKNISNGVESISFFSDQELQDEGIDSALTRNPKYVRARGAIGGVEYFDSFFFGYSPREAEIMDPPLRVIHECVWEALENAGYDPYTYNGLIGFYAGSNHNLMWAGKQFSQGSSGSEMYTIGSLTGNYFSTLISYKLNLKGSSVTVQTACSTSLVAIHLACRSLLTGETDMALAGGVTVMLPNKSGYLYEEGMVLSPDGHCRAFDAEAKGTVPGNGVGVVLLKLLSDALADRDHIYAVIKGSAINNDGDRKVGYPAPSVEGQKEVIRAALDNAEVDPGSITYIETHGTGTPLGDPIEIEALKLAFDLDIRNHCRIGSVKSNVGHLDCAAGVTGFIKAVLALYHRQIPPSLHFNSPNPGFDIENSPFMVNTELTPWIPGEYPLRAGVSSFGIGGTNAHVILEEAPPPVEESKKARDLYLLVLSAKTSKALDGNTVNLLRFLENNPGVNLADVAYTLQVGRPAFKHRRALVCTSTPEAVKMLGPEPGDDSSPRAVQSLRSGTAPEKKQQAVFMFPGQGAQYVNMGRDLYRSEPAFRETIDLCFDIIKPLTPYDFREILYPNEPAAAQTSKNIDQTEVTQPLLFIFEYALAALLMKWGIQPAAMIGHSIGEYAAACLSGVFSLEDALRLVVFRGKAMQSLPAGAMLSVPLPEEKLKPMMGDLLDLAAVNCPDRCVVSGPTDAVEAFRAKLENQALQVRLLHTSHAFHSRMMDNVLPAMENAAKKITRKKPIIPYISNVTGTWITDDQALDPTYYATHLRQTVRFSDGLSTLFREPAPVFIEIGPGKALSTLVRQHQNRKPEHPVFNLIRHPDEQVSDSYFLIDKIAGLWLRGIKTDWNSFHMNENPRRIPLPTYAFDPHFYDIKGTFSPLQSQAGPDQKKAALTKNPDMAHWFYIPSWKRTDLPGKIEKTSEEHDKPWIIFTHPHAHGVLKKLAERIPEKHQVTAIVEFGSQFEKTGENLFTVDPGEEKHYELLVNQLKALQDFQHGARVLHLWNLDLDSEEKLEIEIKREKKPDEAILQRGYFSLINIARAWNKIIGGVSLDIDIITDTIHDVTGTETIDSRKASILGAVRVIPKEYPNTRCRCIDTPLPPPGREPETEFLNRLEIELEQDIASIGPVIALRGRHRWVEHFEPVLLQGNEKDQPAPKLKKQGVYLITGAFGGMGMTFAEELALKWQARLILIHRSPLTPGNREMIIKWEQAGAIVFTAEADVSNPEAVKIAVENGIRQFGTVHGVIHTAGIADYGGVIPRRTPADSVSVLAPKITGTLILDEILKNVTLDFFVLCSSLSSITGPIGQVAYAAANAFLDAFAQQKNLENRSLYLSINWDTWQDLGMAVKAVEKIRKVDHPLFSQRIYGSDGSEIFISRLSIEKYWVLNEHRILGKPVMPATAYLEIARAAFSHYAGSTPFEIRDILMLNPLVVEETEEKEMHTILRPIDNETAAFDFSIMTRSSMDDNRWQEHVRGRISTIHSEPGPIVSISQIQNQCNEKTIDFTAENQPGPGAISVGPRWHIFKQIKTSDRQGIAHLELLPQFAQDLNDYPLHPALMDGAISFLASDFQREQSFLPFSIRKIRVTGALTPQIFSHAVNILPKASRKNTLEFHVSIMDPLGNELVTVEGYKMIAVSQDRRAEFESHTGTGNSGIEKAPVVDDLLKHGIHPNEGIEALYRVLSSSYPQVIVSTVDFRERYRENTSVRLPGISETKTPAQKTGTLHPRPELSMAYAPPANETEQNIANLWQSFFGIQPIGIFDDFFELGGDSLKALALLNLFQKEFRVDVPLSDFFNNPTVVGIAERIHRGEKSTYSQVPPAEDKEYYPLTSAQKRLYLVHQLDRTRIGYNMPFVLLLHAQVDKLRIDEIFKQLISRHDSLRTYFREIDGTPVQIVLSPSEINAEVEHSDFTLPKFSRQNEEIDYFPFVKTFMRPFDLSRPPLIRLGMIAFPGNIHLLMMESHHIVTDGTSQGILMNEFLSLFNRPGTNLPGLPVRYTDFAQWQNSEEQSEAVKKQESFWLNAYPGEIPVLNLPTDFARPEVQRFEGSQLTFTIEEQVTRGLKNLASQEETTLFMVLFALFNIFLSKLSGQDDIVIGTPTAGRHKAELQPLVGMFVNTLAMRNSPKSHKSFRSFLKDVKQYTLKAFENQDYPFEDLIDHVLGAHRDISRNPLFDVMFALHNQGEMSAYKPEIPGDNAGESKVQMLEYETGAAKFDFVFHTMERSNHLSAAWEFSTQLFKLETVERFKSYFLNIISSVLADPGQTIADIEIMDELEKKHILEISNGPEDAFDPGLTVQRLFKTAVEKTPDHIALVGHSLESFESFASEYHFSYRALDALSDGLAFYLSQNGVTRGSIVPVMLDRRVESIIGALAALKSGGAYLPIDPSLPPDRIDYMLKDSSAPVLITHHSLFHEDLSREAQHTTPPTGIKAHHIIDTGSPQFLKKLFLYSFQPVDCHCSDLVYVIYTSGSTGKPKGVMLEHRTMVNLLRFEFGFTSIDFSRVLQFASIGFDVSCQEIFSTLAAAGTLFTVDTETRNNVEDLFHLVSKQHIRTLFLPTAFLKLIESEKNYLDRFPTCVKHAVAAGEQLVITETFKEYIRKSGLLLHNHYGPTECHAVTALTLSPTDDLPDIPPIGTVLPNLTILIIDKTGKIQPQGIPGELIVGGINVGRGYLNNPELTRGSFVKPPLDPAKRLFNYSKEKIPPNKSFWPHLLEEKGDSQEKSDSFIDSDVMDNSSTNNTHPNKSFWPHLLEEKGDSQEKSDPFVDSDVMDNSSTNNTHLNKSFWPHLFTKRWAAGGSLYRTGDLGYWLPDGSIRFLGRMDFQVKIRGYRVELGEIESRIAAFPGIKDVTVMAKQDDSGRQYLCAYYVSGESEPSLPGISEMQKQLSVQLPEYMVPSYYIKLDRIPLSPNGKVDRRALPGPGISAQSKDEAPRNEIEMTLARLWMEVLDLDQIPGIDSNFFLRGGHSLKASILASAIHKAFHLKIPLAEIFRTPTIRGLAGCIQVKGSAGIRFSVIDKAPLKQYYPVSSTQKRLFILQQLTPADIRYNLPFFVSLKGRVDLPKMEEVFRLLIHRHGSLRTSFRMVEDIPVQQVHETGSIPFEIRYYTPTGAQAGQKSIMESFVRAFDLAQPPLIRAGCIPPGVFDDSFVLMVDMHHIISDGISQGILIRDFAALYTGKPLSPLRLQYIDFAQWQAEPAQATAIRNQEHYWIDTFPGEIPVLSLPLDYPRPPVQAFEGASPDFTIPGETLSKLKSMASTQNATLYMVLLAVFNILLQRLSGSETIVVGTPAAGRRHSDLQDIIGMFVNTLPLKNHPQDRNTFETFLSNVKNSTLEAFENQDYPFEDMVEKLSIARDAGRNPLFDVMLVLQNFAVSDLSVPGLTMEPLSIEVGVSKFDMTFICREIKDNVTVTVEYCTKLFKSQTIERFASYFNRIAETVGTQPRILIGDIDILSIEERKQILEKFSRSDREYPTGDNLVDMVRRQVVKTPGSPALIGTVPKTGEELSPSGTMTFSEFEVYSGRLAGLLKQKGIQRGSVVGLMAERSIERIVAIMGILKAGAAYLPLNPQNPPERTRFMLKDSSVSLVVITKGITTVDPGRLGVEVLLLDLTQPFNKNDFPSESPQPGDFAYIVYTSGSTGNPKGVPITHANLSPLLHWGREYMGLSDEDRVIHNLSYFFDWSVWEIFIALTTGAALCVPDENILLDSDAMFQYLEEKRVTALHITPSQWHSLLDNLQGNGLFETLKYLSIGAEKLTYELVRRSFERVTDRCRVFNMYGPTEATIMAAVLEIPRQDAEKYSASSSIPIGYPLGNTRLSVVDRSLNLCPIGVSGELIIGGEGVAEGYLNNPELTRGSFVKPPLDPAKRLFNYSKEKIPPNKSFWPHLFTKRWAAGGSLYRTGDLVRWLPDGSIEFQGRFDHQVKIRGYRVETGEIEHVLLAHSQVRGALVMARKDQKGESVLCAYFIGDLEISDLKRFLGLHLPGYMVPQHMIQMESFPLNPNGKVDLKKLPLPGEIARAVETQYVPPETGMQQTICDTWKEVLQVDHVGIDDNFFDLGGTSLGIIQVKRRLREALGEMSADFQIVSMFVYPTVRLLAGYLEKGKGEGVRQVAEKDRSEVIKDGRDRLRSRAKKIQAT